MDKPQESTDKLNSEAQADSIMTQEDIEVQIRAYEKKYGMDSEEMLRRKNAGELDSYEIMDWAILLKHR